MPISQWPRQERPRERLLAQGPGALSDAELLAIFLRVGIKDKNAVDLARDLLARFDGSLGRLAQASPKALSSLPGIGPAKAAQLAAAIELARRALHERMSQGELLSSPEAVRNWLRLQLGALGHEVFVALWLDAQNRLIECEELFRGTLTQASVFPREVVRHALHQNAAGVVFAHNHPCGLAKPSQADELLTRSLKEAMALVDARTTSRWRRWPCRP